MRLGGWAVVVMVLALAGCRHHRRHGSPPPPPAVVRWDLDPNAPFTVIARVADGGKVLVLGDDGSRRLETAGARAEIAQELYEPFVAARARAGGIDLAGLSGAIYSAPSALGAVKKVADGVARARATAFGATAIVAVDQGGALRRSLDGGKTFSEVSVTKPAAFVSVAMHGERGVALGVPLLAFATSDDGATWSPLAVPPDTKGVLADEGIVVETERGPLRFDGHALVASAPRPKPARRVTLRTAVDGERVARVTADEGGGRRHDVRVEVGAAVHALADDCDAVDLDVSGKRIAATCDVYGTPSVLHVSDDGGAKFHAVAVEASGTPPARVSLAVGVDFLWYGRRCVSGNCSPARVLDEKGWREVDAEPLAIAHDGGDLYHLSDRALYRWEGRVPVRIAELPSAASTIGVRRGVVRAALGSGDVFEVRGGAVARVEIKGLTPTIAVAFAGTMGLASDRLGLLETSDGVSWRRVAGPGGWVESCSASGCLTSRGVRIGWNAKEAERPIERRSARAFVCRPTGEWTELGRSQRAPDADAVDHGASRWVAAMRDEAGGVQALRAGWDGAIDRVRLLDPAPLGPEERSLTTAYVQPAGVVARRLTYTRATDRENPVRLSAAWVRDDGARVAAPARAIGAFRVPRHDPQPAGFVEDRTADDGGFVTWLGPRGLWARAPTTGLWHLRDDGSAQTYLGLAPLDDAAPSDPTAVLDGDPPRVITLGDPTRLLSPRAELIVRRPVLDETIALGPAGLYTSVAGRVIGFDVGAAGVTGVVERGAIDAERACPSGRGAGAITLPRIDGHQRAVLIEDADHRVYVTGRVRARAEAGGACVVAWEAAPWPPPVRIHFGDPAPTHLVYSALVFASDPTRSVELRRDESAWPSPLATRALSCAPSDAPLPDAVAAAPAFD